jgi:hypothetical protein
MKHLLSREDGSVVYNWCWASPAQSFSGPSLAGLMTTFYCLRFETPPTWRYLYPPGAGCPGYTPRHWVPFSSSFKTRRATVEAFDPASTRDTASAMSLHFIWAIYKKLVRTSQETCYVPATQTSRLILFSEIIAVYSMNHTKQRYTLWTEHRVLNVESLAHTVTVVL